MTIFTDFRLFIAPQFASCRNKRSSTCLYLYYVIRAIIGLLTRRSAFRYLGYCHCTETRCINWFTLVELFLVEDACSRQVSKGFQAELSCSAFSIFFTWHCFKWYIFLINLSRIVSFLGRFQYRTSLVQYWWIFWPFLFNVTGIVSKSTSSVGVLWDNDPQGRSRLDWIWSTRCNRFSVLGSLSIFNPLLMLFSSIHTQHVFTNSSISNWIPKRRKKHTLLLFSDTLPPWIKSKHSWRWLIPPG